MYIKVAAPLCGALVLSQCSVLACIAVVSGSLAFQSLVRLLGNFWASRFILGGMEIFIYFVALVCLSYDIHIQ